MSRNRAIFMMWDGECFKPHPSFMPYCNREFVAGEMYPMSVIEQRDMNSHNHYFAALKNGFDNLSEENSKHFPTPEHLRKWALVQCGYCTETNYVLVNSKEARKLAADIRKRDGYAIIKIRDNVLKVFDAESQSLAAMNKEKFQQSKYDVLDLVTTMARTTRAQLMKQHGRRPDYEGKGTGIARQGNVYPLTRR